MLKSLQLMVTQPAQLEQSETLQEEQLEYRGEPEQCPLLEPEELELLDELLLFQVQPVVDWHSEESNDAQLVAAAA